MRRFLSMVIAVCVMLFGTPAIAEVRSFDFDVMSVDELEAVLDNIKAEKKAAVDFSSETFETLKPDFMSTVEGLAPDAVEFDYPFFGLSRDRERTYYAISGSVTAQYADETEREFKDATVVYWHDMETDAYHQVAFLTRDEVHFVNPELLENIERYADEDIYQRLYTYAKDTGLLIEEVLPTPEPTSAPMPTPTLIPTPEPTETATPIATEEPSVTVQYEELKTGSKGQAVIDARMRMYELGYFKKKPTQTEYTRNMMDYVKEFEKDYGLEQDGILSPEDQVVLFEGSK